MRLSSLATVALVGLGVGGCTSTPDSGFAGTYQTTSLTENTSGCAGAESPVPIPSTDLYFQLRDDTLFGVHIVGWHECSSVQVCSDSLDIFRSFGEQADGSWTSVSYSASNLGTMGCTWSYHELRLERVDDMTIRVVGAQYEQTDANAALATCTTDQAKVYGRSMPCVEHTTQIARLTP